jgi:hypothetical protein
METAVYWPIEGLVAEMIEKALEICIVGDMEDFESKIDCFNRKGDRNKH